MKRIAAVILLIAPSAYAWWWAIVGSPGWAVNWAAAITYCTGLMAGSWWWVGPGADDLPVVESPEYGARR